MWNREWVRQSSISKIGGPSHECVWETPFWSGNSPPHLPILIVFMTLLFRRWTNSWRGLCSSYQNTNPFEQRSTSRTISSWGPMVATEYIIISRHSLFWFMSYWCYNLFISFTLFSTSLFCHMVYEIIWALLVMCLRRANHKAIKDNRCSHIP